MRNGTADFAFGKSAFVSRHPAAHDWLEKHDMVLCELNIQQILVIDFYGGAQNVSVADYYKYKAPEGFVMDPATMMRSNDPEDGSAEDYFKYQSKTVELDTTEVVRMDELNDGSIPTNHAKVARNLVHGASKFL